MRVAFIRKSDGKVATIKAAGESWDAENTSTAVHDIFSYRMRGSSDGHLLAKVAGHLPRPHNRLKHTEIRMCELQPDNAATPAIGLAWGCFAQDEYFPDGHHMGSEEGFDEYNVHDYSPLGADVLTALEWR